MITPNHTPSIRPLSVCHCGSRIRYYFASYGLDAYVDICAETGARLGGTFTAGTEWDNRILDHINTLEWAGANK